MTVRTAAVVVLLVLVVLCNLRPCALLLQEEVMAVLPVSEVQRRVFDEDEEGGKGQSWLLVFHHSPRPELVYEALDIITLAMWIRRKGGTTTSATTAPALPTTIVATTVAATTIIATRTKIFTGTTATTPKLEQRK